jgi:predicted GIY-YIG superfamily endonuclease
VSEYSAEVFPYFFYNENGRIYVEVTDDMLRRLERRETVEFSGRAVRSDGVVRLVTGRAVPDGTQSGNIKVRVFVTRKIELIFNTNYRFPSARG